MSLDRNVDEIGENCHLGTDEHNKNTPRLFLRPVGPFSRFA